MKDSYTLRQLLSEFLEGEAGKQLVQDLGQSNRYLRLAVGERCMGYQPVFFLDGTGLRSVTESSALAAALTGSQQEVVPHDETTIDELVTAIAEEGGYCCPASYMYWLEKQTAHVDGITFPKVAA